MRSVWTSVLLVAAAPGFAQEPSGEQKQRGELVAEIDCQEGRSVEDDARILLRFTKVSITLFRSDQKGEKVKGITLKADAGFSETSVKDCLRKLTLNGNVRAEQKDGSVITAKEAVIDLAEETITFKMDVGIEIPQK